MDTKRYYIFRSKDENEALAIRDGLHYQLRGNDDYIKSNIILNYSGEKDRGGWYVVRLYVFEECVEIPVLTLDM